MLGYPLTPPLGTPAADRPTHLPPPPPSRPPKVFTPGWGLEFEQATPLVIPPTPCPTNTVSNEHFVFGPHFFGT